METLIGIVACGGKSARMGQDKFLINYHGKPQYAYVYEQLKHNCEQVFISCKAAQVDKISVQFPTIVDLDDLDEIGPMAALLSAYQKFPQASFLLLGCDYPLLNPKAIEKLIEARNKKQEAICYRHQESELEEPLIAIYEQSGLAKLKLNKSNGKHSLRYFLKESKTLFLNAETEYNITSVDSPEQMEKMKQLKEI